MEADVMDMTCPSEVKPRPPTLHVARLGSVSSGDYQSNESAYGRTALGGVATGRPGGAAVAAQCPFLNPRMPSLFMLRPPTVMRHETIIFRPRFDE